MSDKSLAWRHDEDTLLFSIKIFSSLVLLSFLLVTAVIVIVDSVATVTFRYKAGNNISRKFHKLYHIPEPFFVEHLEMHLTHLKLLGSLSAMIQLAVWLEMISTIQGKCSRRFFFREISLTALLQVEGVRRAVLPAHGRHLCAVPGVQVAVEAAAAQLPHCGQRRIPADHTGSECLTVHQLLTYILVAIDS